MGGGGDATTAFKIFDLGLRFVYMDSDLRKCTFGDSQFFSEKMRYKVRKSPKKISAVLLSFTSREKGESHDRNQKEAVQAGVARCLKQSSDWFKRTPSRFEMRV